MKQLTRKEFLIATSVAALVPVTASCAQDTSASILPSSLTDSKVRVVVTGHTPSGKSIVASDTEIPAITVSLAPGSKFYRLWGADDTVILPSDASRSPDEAWFPPVGGFRFSMFTVPPDESVTPPVVNDAAFDEFETKLPGMLAHFEPDGSGMHTTNTVDFEYVISGEVDLELDDGLKVRLGPGDTVVQNGTRHAWRNPGKVPCVMVVFLVGAHRKV
jgi:mannose-6-phosphate isomerase-like protein (cupin superfamily)